MYRMHEGVGGCEGPRVTKDDGMRPPEIGNSVWNKPSFNYAWLFHVCTK